MQPAELNARIVARGRALFSAISGEKPSLFDTSSWTGKVVDWSMQNEQFKIQLFRFVDVFPSLTTPRQLTDHIREYFGAEKDLPQVLSSGARMAGMFGSLGGALLGKMISAHIREMARQFIIGEHAGEAVTQLKNMRGEGFGAVVDVLGEATLSDDETEAYVGTYLKLLDVLDGEQQRWESLPGEGGNPDMDWGDSPKVSVSVKPTAMFCLANPQDFEGSVQGLVNGMRRICAKVVAVNGFLCIDMESYRFKDITLEVYRRLKLEYRSYPHIGVVLQAYLPDALHALQGLTDWATARRAAGGAGIKVRVVKGANLAMEHVDGVDLSTTLKQGPLPLAITCRVALEASAVVVEALTMDCVRVAEALLRNVASPA